jgi:flagellar capping protein FliD
MKARMDVLTPLVVGILLATFTGVQLWLNKDRFEKQDERISRLEERVDRLEARMERRFDQLAADIAALRSELTAEIGSIRSDLTQIALALGLRARPETG